MRLLGLVLLGLLMAALLGTGTHLITRDTIALPSVRLEPEETLAPQEAQDTRGTTTATARTTTTTTRDTTTQPATTTTSPDETTTEAEDGRGRGRGSDSSGSGSGRDD
jgi:cytoskeletal protein RodZ